MSSSAEMALVLTARNLATKEVDKVKHSLDGVGDSAKGSHGKLGALGSGLADLGKTGLMVAGGGLLALGGALVGATKAAMDEQTGIAQLNSALAAQGLATDANAKAIDDAIAKRENLAFADDDLRSSLTALVGSTGDVNAAIDLQATAMDLARYKGVDLGTATEMVMKASQGNARALKSMGLEVRDGATATELLASIQRTAAGQAEAYGATAQGSMESFGIAIGDVVEDIGGALLPVATELFGWLRENALPVIQDIAGRVRDWISANRPLISTVGSIISSVQKFAGEIIAKVIPAVSGIVSKFSEHLLPAIAKVYGALWGDGSGPLAVAVGAIADIFTNVVAPAIGIVIDTLATLFGWLGDVIDALNSFLGLSSDAAKVEGNGLGAVTTSGSSNSFGAGGHAMGGWIAGGQLSRVNERGTEWFQPQTAGRIYRQDQLPAPSVRGVVLEGVTERELADAIDRRLYLRLRRAGTAV